MDLAKENAPAFVTGIEHFAPLLIPGALRVVIALLILFVGWWVAGQAESLVSRVLARNPRFDQMLRGFFASIARYFILIVVGLTVLAEFGVQTTSLVAVLGAASLAIGLALQGTLSNLAAGVMLLIFRPFRIGHHILVAGNDGTVRDLTLFWTEIVSDANVQIIIPNSGVWGQAIRNFSVYPQPGGINTVRIPIPDHLPLGPTREKLEDILKSVPDVTVSPPPVVMFDRSSADNSLGVLIKFQTSAPDPDVVKGAIIEAVQKALAAGGSGGPA
jgi:small conductance mechanosensitive channel